MAHYNLLTKGVKGREYIITDFIATSLGKKAFERVKMLNKDLLGDYTFVEYKNVDIGFWSHTTKYLTKTKLYKNCIFDIDFKGNITRY